MFGGFFNKRASADDEKVPEVRRVPGFVDINSPDETWITSQVFVVKQGTRERLYYAAEKVSALNEWTIDQYLYSVDSDKVKRVRWSSYYLGNADQAIRQIAELEKKSLELGYIPVAGLKGNYRDIASQNSAYIDDSGNYTVMDKTAPVMKDALFNRESLNGLYAKEKEEPAAPAIVTWDDYYREIVHKFPIENGSPMPVSLSGDEGMKKMNNLKFLQQELMDQQAPLQPKLDILSELMRCPRLFRDAGRERVAYHYGVVILTSLMRAGGEVYRNFATSTSTSPDTMSLLSAIGKTIDIFSRKCFGCSPEKAKELANVIMQGPDPYAHKPLPLQSCWVIRHPKKAARDPKC